MCLSLCIYIRCKYQVWNPWFHKDTQCIECVQRFFTCAIIKRAGIPYMDYDDRLVNLGLQSLEYRRVFYDLVMCYKIYNNLVDLPFESFFTKPARSYSIRGHPCILRSKHLPHHAFRAHFFTERVIPIWNHLPHDVVTSLNITDLLTYHPFVCYIPSMFRQFVSARTLLAFLHIYVCLYVCNQSNQIKSNKH